MTQTITTDLPALTTSASNAIVLWGSDRMCAACGGTLVEESDCPITTFCGSCLAVDLAPTHATLAALAWAKANGHEVDTMRISEWTHEDHDAPPIPIPGRYWSVTLDVPQACMVECPLFVVQQADGQMQVVPDNFAICRDTDTCERYIVTDANGVRCCPEHGPVTAWDMPLAFYTDEDGPELHANDAADFARYGTVQWFDDYNEKVQEADDEEGEPTNGAD
jgi:hypothetical protein